MRRADSGWRDLRAMDFDAVSDFLGRQAARRVLIQEKTTRPTKTLQDRGFVHRPDDRPRLEEVRVQHDADPHRGGDIRFSLTFAAERGTPSSRRNLCEIPRWAGCEVRPGGRHERALKAIRGRVTSEFLPDTAACWRSDPARSRSRGSSASTSGSTCRVEEDLRPGGRPSLPFVDASFDAVIATEVIEHVRYPYRLLTEIRRVTRANGRVLCPPRTLPRR